MARASWKYISYTDIDLDIFYNRFFFKREIYDQAFYQRNNRINVLNYTHKFSIHTGNKYLFFKTSEALYFFNTKLGAVARTLKPFFFRSKDKKR